MFLFKWTAMYAYCWKARKDTTGIYLAPLSHWIWLGKQALVLARIVWWHPKARRVGVPARMHRNKRPGQGWNPATTQTRKRAERRERMGLSGESRMHWLTHTQLQAPHYPITPSVFSPPPPGRSASVWGWKGQGPAAVQPNKSCRSVNHMCQQGHFYLWYVTTAAALPDEIFFSPSGIESFITAPTQTQTTIFGKQAWGCLEQAGRMVWACHDDAMGQSNLLDELRHILW